VNPPLSEAEFSYLTAFGESRRYLRGDDPYAVPDNPRVDRLDYESSATDIYNTPPPGQPGLWCPWVPSCAGECLSIPEQDGRHYGAGPWLQYLYDHFLKPDAYAARTGSALFEDFTFDHRLDGLVAACRSDTGALWLIRPCGDRIEEETLWYGALPDR
jgi:hypothetical protein